MTITASVRARVIAGLDQRAGRTVLVALAAMNGMTGLAFAWILAPLSAGADVETYRRGAEGIRDGTYAYGFLYSPLAGLLATPLTWLPLPAAAVIMSGLGLAVILAGIKVETSRLPTIDRMLILVAAIGFLPVVNELLLGQVTLLLAAAVYPVRDRDGLVRGIPLGIALALAPKPMLLPVLAWMLVRRRRALTGTVVAACAATIAGLGMMGTDIYIAWLGALTATGEITRQGNMALTSLGPTLVVLPLTVLMAVGVAWIILRDERAGFVAALVAGLLLAPFMFMYMASILLVAVRPALTIAARATKLLALSANIAVLVSFPLWAAAGIAAVLARPTSPSP